MTGPDARGASPTELRVRPVDSADLGQVIAIDAEVTGLEKTDYWYELFHLIEATKTASLPAGERRKCRGIVAIWALRYGKGLAWDLVSAARMKLHSQRWRTRRYADEDLWR